MKFLLDTNICIYLIKKKPPEVLEKFKKFLLPLLIVDFDYNAAILYGKISSDLEVKGKPMGPLDNLIAAHALSMGLTLVTNNTREFSRVPNLKIVNWVES